MELTNILAIRKNFQNITKKVLLENKDVDLSKEPALFMGIDFPHAWKNKVYDYETIFPLKKISFEDKSFLAPNMPETVLTSIYGNYMSMPKNLYPRHSNFINMPDAEKNPKGIGKENEKNISYVICYFRLNNQCKCTNCTM